MIQFYLHVSIILIEKGKSMLKRTSTVNTFNAFQSQHIPYGQIVDQPMLGTLRSPLGPLVILGLIRFLIPKNDFLSLKFLNKKTVSVELIVY